MLALSNSVDARLCGARGVACEGYPAAPAARRGSPAGHLGGSPRARARGVLTLWQSGCVVGGKSAPISQISEGPGPPRKAQVLLVPTAAAASFLPLLHACFGGHLDVAQWLILAGAANNVNTGHVDQGILTRDVRQTKTSIRGSLVRLIDAHCVFARLVVPATCIISATAMEKSSTHQRPGEGRSCLLPRLVGHEESLLSLVADFLGLVRGRELRNAREAIEHFEE